MDTDEPKATEPTSESAAPSAGTSGVETEATIMHQSIGEWHGMELLDRDGERIGRLEEIYVDVETDEPQFGTVKEGFFRRHLTFVPLIGITIGPDNLQIAATRDQVRDAPEIALRGEELDQADESALYHHFQLNYTPPDTPSGRRLARRS